jgi:ribosomal protein L15
MSEMSESRASLNAGGAGNAGDG